MMPETASLIQLLLRRLERISVDSQLAHRASGIRGSLLAAQERLASGALVDQSELDRLLTVAMKILSQAAAQVRTPRRAGR